MMKGLKVIESKLVPVYETNKGEKVVYGTELHAVLNVKSNYREWVKRRIAECDAVKDEDYTTVEISTLSGGTPKKENIIKLDTAKEMAMLERNDQGKKVRRYFIAIEKKYKENINANSIITYQYPLPASTFEAAANLGRLMERVMKAENSCPHEIAIVLRSVIQQSGIEVPDIFVKLPAYEQMALNFGDIVTR